MAKTYTKRGAVTDVIEFKLLDDSFPRTTCGITFYTDGTYTTPVTTGLTGGYSVHGIAQGNATYTEFYSSPIDLTVEGAFASAGTPITDVKITPNAIGGATHYIIKLTGNRV